MKRKVKIVGHDLTRTTDRPYTHAVVFINTQSNELGATYHRSEKLAQRMMSDIHKKYHWLQFIEIAKVEELTK
jgi:hypothetical protein